MNVQASPVAAFVESLRQLRLLSPAQLNQLAKANFPDAKSLATDLVKRGWLTTFQANHLIQGKGPALVLGSYVLLDRLGEGGMGQVFKAKHLTLDRIVALKVIQKERLQKGKALERFQREVRVVAQLNHPNIVRALDADEVTGRLMLVMELVEGSDLGKTVRQSGPMPVDQACNYIGQAALGLQHAFQQGFVHRDVKPSNLLLSRDGVVKILDMGLARAIDPADDRTLTQEGSVLGTADYISPEQAISAHTVDIRADIYSLGATMYFVLTGQVPFPGGSLAEKLLKHQLHEPAPLEKLRPDVPAHLAAVVKKMMAKKPEDRFQTPGEVAAALTGGKGVRVPQRREKKRSRLLPFASAVLLLVALGAATVVLSPFLQRGPETSTDGGVVAQVDPTSKATSSKQTPETKAVPPETKQETKPKVEPKDEPKVEPKEQPKIEPKVEPKVEPKEQPKVEQPKDKRTPVPDDVSQTSAEKLIRKLFKDDYAKKAPADMLTLASKLAGQARETKDDLAARFVLFREARDLAAQAADPGMALKVIDEMAKEYAVAAIELKAVALEKVAGATTTLPGNKALVDVILGVVNEAQAGDDYDSAARLVKIADAAAQKTKSVPLVTSVQARGNQVAFLRKEYEASKVAAAALAKKPDDPQANLVMGKYLCLTKGNWEAGLPLLALGGDAKLKDLAKKELAKPGATMAQLELADAWSELAEAEKEPGKTNLQRRALHWYQQALPGLTGLTKTRVEKAVQELTKLAEPEKSITNSIGMKLALIPAGEFIMGSPDKEAKREANEGPQHKVKITKSFYLGVYEVKQGEYEKLSKNQSSFKDPGNPAENVTWDEAVEFCKRLSEMPEEKKAGRVYRLPTDAEWEYACRAGKTTVFTWGNSLASKQANFNGTQPYGGAEKGPNVGKTVKVGSYQPNAWGLFDMHGNVWEWCLDDARTYTPNAVEDPRGSEAAGGSRVLRGGCWRHVGFSCRAARRFPSPRRVAATMLVFAWCCCGSLRGRVVLVLCLSVL